jgi:hypothetical protein
VAVAVLAELEGLGKMFAIFFFFFFGNLDNAR